MKIGQLRHKITVQHITAEVQGPSGETTPTWGTFATVWAAVEPLKGTEYFAAQQRGAEVDIQVRTRYLAGVMPTMRILYGSRLLQIISVIDKFEKRRELIIYCREVV